MIVNIDKIKDVCAKLLFAIDGSGSNIVTETLGIKVENRDLYFSVTNKEYYVKVRIPLDTDETINATVNANIFLRLISQTTTDTVEFFVDDTTLVVKGNGVYNLPMIYENDSLLEIPEIVINNETANFEISSSILTNIMNYNSKELNKGVFYNPVQKMYYIDEKGCITFTTGACITTFTLGTPIKLLLTNKVVKLFKLFTTDNVSFVMGHDTIDGSEIIQSKVKFSSNDVELTSILPGDDDLINSIPVDAIRGRADDSYKYSIVINKDDMIQTINRLLLFNSSKDVLKPYSTFEFNKDSMTIYDRKKENKEIIKYTNEIESFDETYTTALDLTDLKYTLENCKESHVTMNFGNEQAVVIHRPNIYNIIPECHLD